MIGHHDRMSARQHVVELVAHDAGLQPGRVQAHGRRGPLLLLRIELTSVRKGRRPGFRWAFFYCADGYVFHQALARDFTGIDVAARIDRQEFDATFAVLVFLMIGNEGGHASCLRLADPDARQPARIARGVRHAVADIDPIARVDIDAARLAELFPLGDEISLGIEHLDPVVAAIGDVDPPRRVRSRWRADR